MNIEWYFSHPQRHYRLVRKLIDVRSYTADLGNYIRKAVGQLEGSSNVPQLISFARNGMLKFCKNGKKLADFFGENEFTIFVNEVVGILRTVIGTTSIVIGTPAMIYAAASLVPQIILILILSIEIVSGDLKAWYSANQQEVDAAERRSRAHKIKVLRGELGELPSECMSSIFAAMRKLLAPGFNVGIVAFICRGVYDYRDDLCRFICEHPCHTAGILVAAMGAIAIVWWIIGLLRKIFLKDN